MSSVLFVWAQPSAFAANRPADVYEFDINAPTLGEALEAIVKKTGANVLYPFDLASRGGMKPVSGTMSPNEALDVLLQDTGLFGQLTDHGVIIVTFVDETIAAENREVPLRNKSKSHRVSLVASVGAVLISQSAVAQEQAVDSADNNEMDTLVVTGTRGAPRSVLESPIPIDVFSAEALEQVPQVGLVESLRFLVPSLNVPQRAGGGTATFIASAGLRGLNPDQTLILVNGKRRHKTALINTSTGLFSGSAGVDLNMIPPSMIQQIEVLRDGAAAQYGSDAIAGVINIILKDSASGGAVTANYGENFDRGDGEFLNIGLNSGFALGENGFINLSFDYRESQFSNRARPVPVPTDPANPMGLNLFPITDGMFDPREFSVDRLVTTNFGNFPRKLFTGGFNAGYDFGNFEAYAFGTYAVRDSILDFTFRRPRDSRNIPEIFPLGFRPKEEIAENDLELVAGVRGNVGGYDVDVSANYGENQSDWTNLEGLNASLGPTSPTQFFLGEINASELTAQADATRSYDLDQGTLQVSFGLQYRRETFEINRGEPLSFADGNNGRAPGAQGFPGFSPDAENEENRNNFNGYVELGWEPTDKIFLGAAGRYENFNRGAGDQFIYKFNGRYEVTDAFAVRASYNTGFRAPGIQQIGFRGSRGQFADLDNDGIAETIVLRQTLPPSAPAAQALGAELLTPETSRNFSFGFTLDPGYGLTVTVDAYQIDVDDRIALSAQFLRGDNRPSNVQGVSIGDQVSGLLDQAGFDASLGGANYFTNAIDTRSRGIDVVANWAHNADWGDLNLNAAFNYNDTEITAVDDNPEELAGLILANGEPLQQFDRARLGTYTDEIPNTKLVLSANYSFSGAQLTLRTTRFGGFTNVTNLEANDTDNPAKFITDLEVGYKFDSGFALYVGANNVFNIYPDEVRPVNTLGNGFYDTAGPFGFTGGSWYMRAAYRW